jgi:hypothetical protein
MQVSPQRDLKFGQAIYNAILPPCGRGDGRFLTPRGLADKAETGFDVVCLTGAGQWGKGRERRVLFGSCRWFLVDQLLAPAEASKVERSLSVSRIISFLG